MEWNPEEARRRSAEETTATADVPRADEEPNAVLLLHVPTRTICAVCVTDDAHARERLCCASAEATQRRSAVRAADMLLFGSGLGRKRACVAVVRALLARDNRNVRVQETGRYFIFLDLSSFCLSKHQRPVDLQ